MRAVALALAVLLAACAQPPTRTEPSPSPTHEAGALDVSVLLDLSGARAAIGTAQRNAMQIWLDQHSRGTAIKTRVKFVDLASADGRAIVELRRAAVEDRADAVIIGAPLDYDDTFARALEVAQLPVLLTLPAEPTGRWVFGLAPTYAELARLAIDDVSARKLLGPTLLVTDESATAVAERIAISRELERRGVMRLTPVAVNAQDAAQRIRAGASLAKSILFVGSSATFTEAMRSLAASGITPRAYFPYVTETADLSALREAQPMVTWPGSRNIVTFAVLSASSSFLQTYTDRHGAASTPAATAYDALALLDATAASGTDRVMLRDRLETLTFAGVATRYSFTPMRHSGFAVADLAYLRWITAGLGRTGIALAPEPEPKEER